MIRTMMTLFLMTVPVSAGEADRGHDFRDVREALIRQLSPEGRYCRECHARPRIKRVYTPSRIPEVPLPQTALLFGTALGGLVIVKKWRKA